MGIKFVSGAGEATKEIQQYLAQRMAEQRQQMLDQVTVGREARLGENMQAQTKLAEEEAASRKALRESTIAENTRQDAAAKEKQAIGSMKQGDAVTPEFAKQYPAWAQPTQPVEAAPDENGFPTFQIDPNAQEFKGTPAERAKNEQRDKVRSIIEGNPELAQHQGVNAALQVAEATGDYSGIYGALATMTKDPKSPHHFAVDPKAGTMKDLGEVPEGSSFTNTRADGQNGTGRIQTIYAGDGVHVLDGQGNEIRRYDNKLGETAQKEIVNAESLLNDVKQLEGTYNSQWVGPLKGRYKTMALAFVGEGNDAGLASTAQLLATLNNTIVNLRTGAQMSEPEAQRIMAEAPNMNLPPDVFVARLNGMRRKFEDWLNRRADIGYGRRTDVGGSKPPAPPAKAGPAPAAPAAPAASAVAPPAPAQTPASAETPKHRRARLKAYLPR